MLLAEGVRSAEGGDNQPPDASSSHADAQEGQAPSGVISSSPSAGASRDAERGAGGDNQLALAGGEGGDNQLAAATAVGDVAPLSTGTDAVDAHQIYARSKEKLSELPYIPDMFSGDGGASQGQPLPGGLRETLLGAPSLVAAVSDREDVLPI